jgi:hypothetical protein
MNMLAGSGAALAALLLAAVTGAATAKTSGAILWSHDTGG